MAIGHLSIRSHTRSAGHSVAAGLAYRFRTTLVDSRTGITHDYDRPDDQAAASGFAYGETQPSWDPEDPQAWADAIESAERRKNSIVARDIDIALPHELTAAQRTELARTWASHVAHAYDVPVAWAVHQPSAYSDARNHHAHFYVGTRALDPGTGLPGKKLREFTLDGSSHTITKLRHEWQTVCNDALDAAEVAAQPAPRYQDRAASALATHQYGDVTIDLRPFAEALEAERRERARMASQPDAIPISMGAFARHDGYQVIDRSRDRKDLVTSWRVGDQLHFDRMTTRHERAVCVVENRINGYDAPHLTPTAIALERHARDVRDGDAKPGSAPARSDRTPTRGRQSVAELLEDGEPATERGRRGRRSLEERRAARKRRRRRRATAQTLRETEPLSAADTIPAAPTRPEPATAARIPGPHATRAPKMPPSHAAQAQRQKLAAELALVAAIPDPEIAAFERERTEEAHAREWRIATAQHARPDPRAREVPHASEMPAPEPAQALPAIEGEHDRAAAQRRGRRSLEERRASRKRRRPRMPTAPARPKPATATRIPGPHAALMPSTTAVFEIHVQVPIPHPVAVTGFVGVQREETRTVDYRRHDDPRGAVAFRDHGDRITVQSRHDPAALLAALRVARERNSGRPVRVRGSAAFRARVLRIAATHGIPAVDAGRVPKLPRAPEPDAPARATTLPAIPARARTVDAGRVPKLPRAPEPDAPARATTLPAVPARARTVDAGRVPKLPRAPEPDAPARATTLPAIPARARTVDAGRVPKLPRAPEPDAPARATTLPAIPARARTVDAGRVPKLPRAPEPDAPARATTLPAIDNESLALADLRRLLAAITARIAKLRMPSAAPSPTEVTSIQLHYDPNAPMPDHGAVPGAIDIWRAHPDPHPTIDVTSGRVVFGVATADAFTTPLYAVPPGDVQAMAAWLHDHAHVFGEQPLGEKMSGGEGGLAGGLARYVEHARGRGRELGH